MPFEKAQSEKLSQSIVRQIELLILRGILRPGERLPSERELSEKMDVSRPSLREAIAAPAEQVGATVEPELTERLVADAASEPGILPLLQLEGLGKDLKEKK